jgi:hypothetical protein
MGRANGQQGKMGMCMQIDPNVPLSDKDIVNITFMREEEKVARDVYTVLAQKWDSRVFDNISHAEQRHMDAIAQLIKVYQLTDPVVDSNTGSFTNQDLQKLNDDLVVKGQVSYIEALKVGALIEEVDIADLENAIAETANAGVTAIFNNLNRGSFNHLRAFVRVLGAQGVTYTPQVLTEQVYNEIINAKQQAGSKGNRPANAGRSRGKSQGKGRRSGFGRGRGR